MADFMVKDSNALIYTHFAHVKNMNNGAWGINYLLDMHACILQSPQLYYLPIFALKYNFYSSIIVDHASHVGRQVKGDCSHCTVYCLDF